MRLRKQLLILALLSFSLPWAGARLIVKVENALRAGQEHSAAITVQTIATALARDIDTPPEQAALFLPWRQLPLQLDGYSGDWEHVPSTALPGPNDNVHYRLQRDDEYAYVLIEVKDTQINYYNPAGRPLKNGDRAHLSLDDRIVALTASAPGRISAKHLHNTRAIEDNSVQAYWRDTDHGYQIEARLALSDIETRFAIAVVDDTLQPQVWRSPRQGQAVSASNELRSALQVYVNQGSRLQLLSPQGWPLLQLGSLRSRQNTEVNWVLREIYRSLLPPPAQQAIPTQHLQRREVTQALAGSNVAMQWYKRTETSNRHLLASASPVQHQGATAAVLVLEQSSEPFLTLTDRAFTSLISSSLLALSLTLFGFLLYASWLSYRVRQLSQAASASLGQDGRINQTLPLNSAGDELGELSRTFTQLLGNIAAFTDYLQTLSRKLSHELRTPLAVVRSSLDNLAQEQLSPPAQRYLQRANEGTKQLSHLLTALSEATRVEQSITNTDKEHCDIVALLRDLSQAYQDIYPTHVIAFESEQAHCQLYVAPELLVQMMDKLIANATDFAPVQSRITIALQNKDNATQISVINRGPALDPGMHDKLFDSMVSIRQGESDEPHLGLGLYIVKLIANFHNGHASAANTQDGVIFKICLQATRD